MAYDGIVISNVINDIKSECLGGRVVKVQQPSSDTITFTIKGFKGQTKLYMSVNNSLPIVYIADTLPQAPMQAPAFCMLLRKHLGNGRLTDIRQPGFDRVFDFVFEHLDEMGDLAERHLIIEIMGRQSNIILTDADYMIMDCLRRVMPDLGAAILEDTKNGASNATNNKDRILFPGQKYEAPDSQGKLDPVSEEIPFDRDLFEKTLVAKSVPIPKAIFTSITGFSKSTAEYIVDAAGVDGRKSFADVSEVEKDRLFEYLSLAVRSIKAGAYSPKIIYVDGRPKDYLSISEFRDIEQTGLENQDSISKLLIRFYSEKEKQINVRSKASDIKKLLQTAIERSARKYDLQRGQLADTEDRDKYRIYGELLNTYGYELRGGEDSLTCINYYDNQEIKIPLDPTLTAQENSQKYFAKYNKKKRTSEALTDFVKQTREELDYLLSAKHSLDMAENDEDIAELRSELERAGVIKKKASSKGARKMAAGKPLHFISSDGYDIYVGKNNIQNEELTFGLATGRDLWFHAKQMPGSHVIVKVKEGDLRLEDIPDRVFEEAAGLAAYYSSGSNESDTSGGSVAGVESSQKIEVDYTERKNLKKPPQARPGYVIYHTNYSMMAAPSRGNLTQM
ncbi:Predicted component of the ribosome quality control (RQC) complex, YloA/Tae2 family, contains fibronectin-binding (FbpA) and DUF814 domains [Lachnospiraceae bacterium NE2001]|nr:Predicted component of the ribosome quality control (RQC) complex, YloA/Tae2 family, contains fibronectin-binding (FbpA) and DUF814 domains [Lachnospiraceae bacterium NE2001]